MRPLRETAGGVEVLCPTTRRSDRAYSLYPLRRVDTRIGSRQRLRSQSRQIGPNIGPAGNPQGREKWLFSLVETVGLEPTPS